MQLTQSRCRGLATGYIWQQVEGEGEGAGRNTPDNHMTYPTVWGPHTRGSTPTCTSPSPLFSTE